MPLSCLCVCLLGVGQWDGMGNNFSVIFTETVFNRMSRRIRPELIFHREEKKKKNKIKDDNKEGYLIIQKYNNIVI